MKNGGRVIWLTGLSGSGKTTLARALLEKLPEAVLLDGDELRSALGVADQQFDAEERKKLAFTYARLARLIAMQGLTVVVATISLFHELHQWNRENLPGYFEIFLDVPSHIRQARDPKQLYKKAQSGQVSQMAGQDVPVQFPKNPHLILTEKCGVEESVQLVLGSVGIEKNGN